MEENSALRQLLDELEKHAEPEAFVAENALVRHPMLAAAGDRS
jgi:hypothetical protein